MIRKVLELDHERAVGPHHYRPQSLRRKADRPRCVKFKLDESIGRRGLEVLKAAGRWTAA
jgi:hypothetical protein